MCEDGCASSTALALVLALGPRPAADQDFTSVYAMLLRPWRNLLLVVVVVLLVLLVVLVLVVGWVLLDKGLATKPRHPRSVNLSLPVDIAAAGAVDCAGSASVPPARPMPAKPMPASASVSASESACAARVCASRFRLVACECSACIVWACMGPVPVRACSTPTFAVALALHTPTPMPTPTPTPMPMPTLGKPCAVAGR